MAVELILLDDVETLGKLGDSVRVSDGYARNFLLPRKLGMKSTPGTLRQLESKKIKLQKQYEDNLNVAKTLAEKISSTSITITMQANEDEKLFGSVSPKIIADTLQQSSDISIDSSKVVLRDPIRTLGVFDVDIFLHQEVSTTLKVWVVDSK